MFVHKSMNLFSQILLLARAKDARRIRVHQLLEGNQVLEDNRGSLVGVASHGTRRV